MDLNDFLGSLLILGKVEAPLAEAQLRELARRENEVIAGLVRPEIFHSGVSVARYFDTLVRTANDPTLGVLHRVKAYDVLCSFVGTIYADETHCLDRRYACDRLISLYLDRHDSLKAKHNKRVLKVLVAACFSSSEKCNDVVSLRSHVYRRLYNVIFLDQDHVRARPAFEALTLLVKRDTVSVSSLPCFHESATDASETALGASEGLLQSAQHTLNLVIPWFNRQQTAQAAGHFTNAYLASLETAHPELRERSPPLWTDSVLEYCIQDVVETFAWRNYVLPTLFERNAEQYWSFIHCLQTSELTGTYPNKRLGTRGQELLHISLQVGIELGLVAVKDARADPEFRQNQVQISVASIAHMLSQSSLASRLAGLSLLVSSKARTKPLTPAAMTMFLQHTCHLQQELDAGFRGQFLSVVHDLLNRLRTVIASLAKPYTDSSISFDERDSLYQPFNSNQHRRLNHAQFLAKLCNTFVSGLHPCSNYQQHISSVRALNIIVRSSAVDILSDRNPVTTRPLRVGLFTSKVLRLLQDLLLDPFDDVRHQATQLLLYPLAPTNTLEARLSSLQVACNYVHQRSDCLATYTPVEEQSLDALFSSARDRVIKTGRADHGDGLARVFTILAQRYLNGSESSANFADEVKLTDQPHASSKASLRGLVAQCIFMLRVSLEVASQNLTQAVEAEPVHAYFTCLNSCLNVGGQDASTNKDRLCHVFHESFLTIMDVIERFWHLVKPILCNDAPEGFILEDVPDEAIIDTKSVLSWAWRGLKEASLVYVQLLSCLRLVYDLVNVDYHQVLERVGNATFQQLAHLRHRGAFSTVANTFLIVCEMSHQSQHEKARGLLDCWYRGALALMKERGSSITRRSAGIPSIIVGLVSSTRDEQYLPKAISDLKEIALEPAMFNEIKEVDLPQVHALNSLRSLFLAARLCDQTDLCIVSSMDLALECLVSKVWSIRNSGLMLLRSLISRLLGSHEVDNAANAYTSSSSKLAYARYPGLLQLMHTILSGFAFQNASSKTHALRPLALATEAYFPVLDLIRRVTVPDDEISRFRPLVLRAAESPQWHLRIIAARAYASMLKSGDDLAGVIEAILKPFPTESSVSHGRSLCAYHLCRRRISQLETATQKPNGIVSGKLKDQRWLHQILLLLDSALQHVLILKHQDAVITTLMEVSNLIGSYLLDLDQSYPEAESAFTKISARFESMTPRRKQRTATAPCSDLFDRERLYMLICKQLLLDSWRMSERRALNDINFNSNHVVSQLLEANSLVSLQALQALWTSLSRSASSMQLKLLQILTRLRLRTKRKSMAIFCQDVITDAAQSNAGNHHFMDTIDILLRTLPLPDDAWKARSPIELESNVRMTGFILGASINIDPSQNARRHDTIKNWILSTRFCLENNDFALRNAAITGLRGFSQAVCRSHHKDVGIPRLLDVLFTLYDAMNDDDDENRSVAAQAAAHLLSVAGMRCPTHHPVPIIAQQILGKFLVKTYSSDPYMLEQALQRLTCGKGLLSVSKQLQDALKNDDTLFVVEKQNLYIDCTRESFFWSRILRHLHPQERARRKVSAFARWIIDAIATLHGHTERGHDGALGWTSKPEVFALGMRVIHAAGVLLAWRMHGVKRMGVRSSGIRIALRAWADIGHENGIHPMWLDAIEEVLEHSIHMKVLRIGRVLQATGCEDEGKSTSGRMLRSSSTKSEAYHTWWAPEWRMKETDISQAARAQREAEQGVAPAPAPEPVPEAPAPAAAAPAAAAPAA
ncbi:MAG: hypothetical protein Q9159_001420 [Coniocarpon cinnabarinum]